MHEAPLVSVIIPVYNAEVFLPRLVELIRGQSFLRWETCFIIGGGGDESASIITKAIREDRRMKMIVQPNQGVSVARNRGIRETQSETFTFIDVDDLVLPTYLEILYSAYNQGPEKPDWIMGGWSPLHLGEGLRELKADVVGEKMRFAHLNRGFLTQWLTGVVWAKLFNRAWFKTTGIFFDESLTVGEDTLFMQEVLLRSRKVIDMSTYRGYGYRLPETGMSLSSRKKHEYIVSRLCILKKILDFHRLEKIDYKSRVIYLANMQNSLSSLMEAIKVNGIQKTYDMLYKLFPEAPWRLVNGVCRRWRVYAIVFVIGMRTKVGLLVALYVYARIRQLQCWYGSLRAIVGLKVI